MSQLETTSPGQIVLEADREHGGIQFAVPLIMLVSGILIWLAIDPWVLKPLLGGGFYDSFRPFLRLVLAVLLGVGVGGAAETLLKRVWSSGRRLILDDTGLTVEDKESSPARVTWEQRVNVLRWQYPMRGFPRGGRERRIPNGHLLAACRLVQDDEACVAFSFFGPKQAGQIPGLQSFVTIEMAELYGRNPLGRMTQPTRPAIPAQLLSGRHGQVWAAEKQRWVNGFELDPNDFVTLMTAIERYAVRPQA